MASVARQYEVPYHFGLLKQTVWPPRIPSGVAERDSAMSIDSTLKRGSRLARARNVLTREERIQRLKETDRWQEGSSPVGLPKVRIVKTVVGKKKKKKKDEEEGDAKKDAKGGKKK